MFRWLRKFFYSDDPVVKLVGALTEPEAEMWRELLENGGITAMVKYVGALGGQASRPLGTREFDLFVKQSDLERAREILTPMLESEEDAPDDEAGI